MHLEACYVHDLIQLPLNQQPGRREILEVLLSSLRTIHKHRLECLVWVLVITSWVDFDDLSVFQNTFLLDFEGIFLPNKAQIKVFQKRSIHDKTLEFFRELNTDRQRSQSP